jgi:hypothetical protein
MQTPVMHIVPPLSAHAVPFASNASVGHIAALPVQVSAMSHSPASGRQTVDAGWKTGTHIAVAPTAPAHTSCASQSPDGAPPQDVPGVAAASAGQDALDPVHDSAKSHWPTDARQLVAADANRGSHVAVAPTVPAHTSCASHVPEGAPPHEVPGVVAASAGQAVLDPVHVSAASHSPTDARHVTLAAANRGSHVAVAPTVPAHTSCASHVPEGAPPQAVPAIAAASVGHVALAPVQLSATSHPPATAARHTTDGAAMASTGHVAPEPVHVSATSHPPAAAPRQITDGASSTSVGHAALDPVQLSAMSQTSTAARHSIEPGAKASPGQTVVVPVQVSSTSQGPAAARQTVDEGAGPDETHAGAAPEQSTWPSSHGLPVGHAAPGVQVVLHVPVASQNPASDVGVVHAKPTDSKTSAGQVVAVPLHVSATSQSPASARQTTLVLATASTDGQARLVPSHVSATSHGPAIARQTWLLGRGVPLPMH